MDMPLVYIAGPISKGNLARNIARADAAFFSLLRAGVAAICPHWSCFAGSVVEEAGGVYAEASILPCGTTHSDWYGMDLVIVRRCDAVLRLPGESTGADLEVKEAHAVGIPVFETVAEVVEWARKRKETTG